MAKLTDRTELATPADGDWYVTTDVSDTSDAATGTDKKITWSNIKATLKTYFDTLYGNVSKVGTPADNQIGVWTGDGTIEGDAGLTFNTATDTLTVTGANPTLVTLSSDGSKIEAYPTADSTYLQVQDNGATNIGPYLELYKNSATPAANDDVGSIYFVGEDSAGNKQNYAQIQGLISDTTSTSEDGFLRFWVTAAGAITNKIDLTNSTLTPTSNDGVALGQATLSYSDLYLAEGGVINWDNGDVTLTQTGNQLEVAGGDLKIGTLTGVLRADTGVVSTDSDVTDLVSAASTTAAGKAEASIASEVNTGTDDARYVSPDSLAGSNFGIRYAQCVLNGTTALTTSEKVYFRIPAALNGMNLVSVTGTVGTGAAGSSSSGTPTFTVKNVTDNQQMLTTSLTIDANEYTSATAATAVVINTTYDDVATDDLIEVAVTTAGTGVTYATVTLGFQLP